MLYLTPCYQICRKHTYVAKNKQTNFKANFKVFIILYNVESIQNDKDIRHSAKLDFSSFLDVIRWNHAFFATFVFCPKPHFILNVMLRIKALKEQQI